MIHELLPFKNIIFDLGGVILDLGIEKTIQEFKKIGIPDFDKLYSYFKSSKIFIDFELGKITPNDFRNQLRKFTNNNLSDEEIDFAWNTMIVNIPLERLQLLEKLSERYRTFLLSNTNEIHLKCYNNIIKKKSGHFSLADIMEKAYYSHEIHFKKPDPRAYEYVLSKNDLKAKETLFIDDFNKNVDAAIKLGMKAFQLEDPDKLVEYFEKV